MFGSIENAISSRDPIAQAPRNIIKRLSFIIINALREGTENINYNLGIVGIEPPISTRLRLRRKLGRLVNVDFVIFIFS